MIRSVLKRNLPKSVDYDENGGLPKALHYHEDLTLAICVNTAKIVYKDPGSEFHIYGKSPAPDEDVNATAARLAKRQERRHEIFQERFVMNCKWMEGLNHEEVSQATQDFNTRFGKPSTPQSASVNIGMTDLDHE